MEILGFTIGMAMFWIIAAIILAIIEAFTLGLTTIWFAGGAAAAAISTLFTHNVFIQIVIFLVVSCVLLYLTKPLKEKLRIGKERTNVDAIVGKTGFVTETISPETFGQVKVGGLIWTAMSSTPNLTIAPGAEVTIAGVEGVKLIVTPNNTSQL